MRRTIPDQLRAARPSVRAWLAAACLAVLPWAAPNPLSASAGGDVTGTWTGTVRVAGVDRTLALQLHARRSGEVYAYALGASPEVTARGGRISGGRLTLRLDWVDRGTAGSATRVLAIDALLSGDRLDGFVDEGSRGVRSVSSVAPAPTSSRSAASP